MKKNYFLLFILLSHLSWSQTLPDVTCEVLWEDAKMGDCMGYNNSLIPYDFDNDGTMELITNANAKIWSLDGYWYVLKYNSTTNDYDKIYISQPFEKRINKLLIADIDGDDTDELLIGTERDLHIFDLTTLTVEASLFLDDIYFSDEILQIKFADGDNDGQDEILVSAEDDFLIINPLTLQVENYFELETGDFDIANVDDDAQLEIVFTHGSVIQIANGNYLEEYDFRPGINDPDGFIELSDIDNDGRNEAIVCHKWYVIEIFDVETGNLREEIDTDADNSAFMMQDINNDGIEEIFYGEKQGGEVTCHDAITGNKLWDIYNNDSGVTGFAIADLDGDQIDEFAWGAGCASTGADFFRIFDLQTQTLEWESIPLANPYYAIEIADVDDDGIEEIITLNFTDPFVGNWNGASLKVYNAITKEVEFVSEVSLMPNSTEDMFSLEVVDFLNDGDMDIVIGAGGSFGKIWVIDGDSKVLEQESSFNFQDGVKQIYAHETVDVDSDGEQEIVIATERKVHVINSNDFTLEWSSEDIIGYPYPSDIRIGNVDSDPELEIIMCRDHIYKFDGGTYLESKTVIEDYTSLELFNWDESTPQLEIIVGHKSGVIEILDGTTLSVLNTFQVSSEEINGLAIADFSNNGSFEIMAVTADPKIVFINQEGAIVKSQMLYNDLGLYDGIAVKDYDADGELNIFLGSQYRVSELNPNCSKCLDFKPEFIAIDPKCNEDNGIIIGVPSDNNTTFYFSSNTFTDSIIGLGEGTFTVLANSIYGCTVDSTLELTQQQFTVLTTSNDQSCQGVDGEIFTNVIAGTPPYNYEWSNGVTIPFQTGIPAGTYDLTVTDAAGCMYLETFFVGQTELVTELLVTFPACQNLNSGEAEIVISEGLPPYEILLDNNSYPSTYLSNLGPGMHEVMITDANGCNSGYDFEILLNELEATATPLSISCNGDFNGSAEVNVDIGNSPFDYQWSDGLGSSSFVENLTAGTYFVTVSDHYGCTTVDTVVIENQLLTLNSDIENLACFGDMDGSVTVSIDQGIPPYSLEWNTGDTTYTLTGLSQGNYFAFVTDASGCSTVEDINISSPPELVLELDVTPDTSTTTVLDGSIFPTVLGGTSPYQYIWSTGSIDDSLTNLEVGEYFLTITDANNCVFESSPIIVDLFTSLNSIDNIQVKIYPNPTSDFLYLETNKKLPTQEIKLFAIDGKQINFSIEEINSDKKLINLAHLSNGEYLLIFSLEGNYYFEKIILHK